MSPAEPVSVVVVNYNGEGALEGCLEALLSDGSGPAEILVVDNASSDGSAEIAERAAESHDRVRLIRSPTNRGYAGAVAARRRRSRTANHSSVCGGRSTTITSSPSPSSRCSSA